MINILLVDDERLMLQGFQSSIDWEQNGYHIIGAVDSASKAISLCETNQPDIALLDINMPDINGLDLGLKIREMHPNVVIIILSAYSDFEYAREAVRRQFDEYILKPEVSFEEILYIMDNFKETIKDKQKKRLASKVEKLERLFLNYRMEPKLYAKEFFANFEQKIHPVPDENQKLFCYALCETSNLVHNFSSNHFVESALLIFQTDGKTNWAYYPLPHNHIALFSLLRENESPIIEAEGLVALFEREDLNITVGISAPCVNRNELLTSFEQAKRALNRKFYVDDQILLYKSFSSDTQAQLQKLNEFIDSGERLLNFNDFHAFADITNFFFTRIRESELSRDFLSNVYIQILLLLTKKIQERDTDINKILGYQNFSFYNEISKCNSFFEMHNWFQNIFTKLIRFLDESKGEQKSQIIQEIMKFIMENISDPDLCLSMIADRFYLSYTYLSQLFKKETNDNFSHFLSETRISAAKTMLTNHSMKISDIAAKCGFCNVSYFNKVFKRETSMTPSEYRYNSRIMRVQNEK